MSIKLALVVAASIFVLDACAGNGSAVGSERIAPGDYSNASKGVFRRIVVTQSPQIAYDVWRTDPYGVFQHLHFTLTAPAQYPTESSAYIVRGPGLTCDSAELHLYREQNKANPQIVILRFGADEMPLRSAGPALAASLHDDDHRVAALRRNSSNPSFYDSIPLDQRGALLEGVPSCH